MKKIRRILFCTIVLYIIFYILSYKLIKDIEEKEIPWQANEINFLYITNDLSNITFHSPTVVVLSASGITIKNCVWRYGGIKYCTYVPSWVSNTTIKNCVFVGSRTGISYRK